MAAIAKPDGGIRPLHDWTDWVRVRHGITYRDRIQCPGRSSSSDCYRECSESFEAPFAVAADIKSAHSFKIGATCAADQILQAVLFLVQENWHLLQIFCPLLVGPPVWGHW